MVCLNRMVDPSALCTPPQNTGRGERRLEASSQPRLLFIDAYDSFTNNIISLLRSELHATITTVRIDEPRFQGLNPTNLDAFLTEFDAVVIGPGPGDPRVADDVGISNRLWSLLDDRVLPVLGICLGFQSLALAFGGTIERLNKPRHGLITAVSHQGQSLFAGAGDVRATQYHSLQATLGHQYSEKQTDLLWQSTGAAPDLEPLAWDFSDSRNGPVLMAIRHMTKPFWGVQYHPESICTNPAGASILRSWWTEVCRWRKRSSESVVSLGREASAPGGLDSGYASDLENEPVSSRRSPLVEVGTSEISKSDEFSGDVRIGTEVHPPAVLWKQLAVPSGVDLVPALCDHIRSTTGQEPLLLESGTKMGKPVRAETGRFTILGQLEDECETYRYWSDRQHLERVEGQRVIEETQCSIFDAFSSLKGRIAQCRRVDGPPDTPFWGGLMGFVSYEAGLETISVPSCASESTQPDMQFVNIRRSIVIDHVDNKLYIQSTSASDDQWLDQESEYVSTLIDQASQSVEIPRPLAQGLQPSIRRPDRDSYCQKVATCQDHIRAGDSYELCLTDRSDIHFSNDMTTISEWYDPRPWAVYSRLRTTNPAPFGAYFSFKDLAIMSSSPERFLSWSREGVCEFRPIKGTVQKTADMTRQKAEAILKSEKEQAENLMIVDLIRHDLNGVVGCAGRTASVPKLMQVEEYETVYQLVSVIRGELEKGEDGIDVLQSSLPPGSMTGAPKKRSCELLGEISTLR